MEVRYGRVICRCRCDGPTRLRLALEDANVWGFGKSLRMWENDVVVEIGPW